MDSGSAQASSNSTCPRGSAVWAEPHFRFCRLVWVGVGVLGGRAVGGADDDEAGGRGGGGGGELGRAGISLETWEWVRDE